jgi:hypothetical protein
MLQYNYYYSDYMSGPCPPLRYHHPCRRLATDIVLTTIIIVVTIVWLLSL